MGRQSRTLLISTGAARRCLGWNWRKPGTAMFHSIDPTHGSGWPQRRRHEICSERQTFRTEAATPRCEAAGAGRVQGKDHPRGLRTCCASRKPFPVRISRPSSRPDASRRGCGALQASGQPGRNPALLDEPSATPGRHAGPLAPDAKIHSLPFLCTVACHKYMCVILQISSRNDKSSPTGRLALHDGFCRSIIFTAIRHHKSRGISSRTLSNHSANIIAPTQLEVRIARGASLILP